MQNPASKSEPKPLEPILVAALFPVLDAQLIALLGSLTPADWEAQTVSPKWKVKDVAAHLLDTALRGLSVGRDGFLGASSQVTSREELVSFINQTNGEGVAIYRRLSPPVLISLMQIATRMLAEYHATRDPFSKALFPVSWAGESESLNWFDTAREFTERWHHQQQIRLAVNKPGILTRELYFPVLDALLRALPFTYREVSAVPGAVLRVRISGHCGGLWTLLRGPSWWQLVEESESPCAAEIAIPQEIAWRIFTKGIDRASVLGQVTMTGDARLAVGVLDMISVIA